MSKLKVACWLLGTGMLLTIIFFQIFKPISPQDEWENVNEKMASTLQLESISQTENSRKPTEQVTDIPKQQVDKPTQTITQTQTDTKTETQTQTGTETKTKIQTKTQPETQPETQSKVDTQEQSLSNLININTATLEILDSLPGVGPSKAKAIIEYRVKYGDFKSLEQLMEVKGIGPKIFAKMKEKITIATHL